MKALKLVFLLAAATSFGRAYGADINICDGSKQIASDAAFTTSGATYVANGCAITSNRRFTFADTLTSKTALKLVGGTANGGGIFFHTASPFAIAITVQDVTLNNGFLSIGGYTESGTLQPGSSYTVTGCTFTFDNTASYDYFIEVYGDEALGSTITITNNKLSGADGNYGIYYGLPSSDSTVIISGNTMDIANNEGGGIYLDTAGSNNVYSVTGNTLNITGSGEALDIDGNSGPTSRGFMKMGGGEASGTVAETTDLHKKRGGKKFLKQRRNGGFEQGKSSSKRGAARSFAASSVIYGGRATVKVTGNKIFPGSSFLSFTDLFSNTDFTFSKNAITCSSNTAQDSFITFAPYTTAADPFDISFSENTFTNCHDGQVNLQLPEEYIDGSTVNVNSNIFVHSEVPTNVALLIYNEQFYFSNDSSTTVSISNNELRLASSGASVTVSDYIDAQVPFVGFGKLTAPENADQADVYFCFNKYINGTVIGNDLQFEWFVVGGANLPKSDFSECRVPSGAMSRAITTAFVAIALAAMMMVVV